MNACFDTQTGHAIISRSARGATCVGRELVRCAIQLGGAVEKGDRWEPMPDESTEREG